MPRRKQQSSPHKKTPTATGSLRARFPARKLRQRFALLFSPKLVRQWLLDCPESFLDRLFIPLVTLWYLVFQRLQDDHSLGHVLADAHLGGADALGRRGKPLSQRIISTATTAFSDARQRLPLQLLHHALAHSAQEIRAWAHHTCWQGWNVLLLDGSTVRLRSLGDIPKVFPAQRSARGQTYWCLMRVVVGFCLNTGVAVTTAMSACSTGEQALALPLLAQLGPRSLLVADRNFGIFSVAQAARDAAVQVVIRLTAARAGKLARDNGLQLHQTGDHAVHWTASRHDRANPASDHRTLRGRLLILPVHRRGFRSQVLYLFTSLTDASRYTPQAILALYGRRWQAEVDLRFVKTEMDLGALECKSAAMAQKEWVAGLLAYNLIRSLMVAAAAKAGISVWTLSFSRTRQFLVQWLAKQSGLLRAADHLWERLLELIARCRQPKRSKPRPAEPRAKRYFKQDFPSLKGSRAVAREKMNAGS